MEFFRERLKVADYSKSVKPFLCVMGLWPWGHIKVVGSNRELCIAIC